MAPTTAQSFPVSRRPATASGRSDVSSKFAVVCELGQGGMADVLLAIARGPAGFNKLVVLKQIRQSFAEDPHFLQMLLDEARLSAQLSHPNIVQTYETGVDAGRHYLSMEYLEGQSLSRILRRLEQSGRELPLGFALRIAADALAGLHYAHELVDLSGKPLGITHRDVSPHNLFVTYAGQVKVLDFGLAKAMSSTVETQSGVIRGKLSYMAPEQASAKAVDRRSDIFSLGVVLWEMVTGRPLWRGQTDIEIACNLRFGEIPRIASLAPTLPKPVADACTKALAFFADERFQTAAAFRARLLELLNELDPRVTNEAIGELVSELFAEERAHIRNLIESRVAELSAESRELARASRRGVRRRYAAVLAATTLVMGGVILARRIPGETAPEARPAAAPAQRHEPADAPLPVHVEIRVEKEHARIYWDDQLLEGNPFRGQFARDGSTHRVRAEAPGYLPYETIVTLDQDRSIELPLVPVATVSPPPSSEQAHPVPKQPRRAAPALPGQGAPSEAPAAPPSAEDETEFRDPWGGQ